MLMTISPPLFAWLFPARPTFTANISTALAHFYLVSGAKLFPAPSSAQDAPPGTAARSSFAPSIIKYDTRYVIATGRTAPAPVLQAQAISLANAEIASSHSAFLAMKNLSF
jgi:hypothetical protein